MNINIQPIEKYVGHENGEELEVHSIFHTIQGEGPLTGHPAIFIRLAGCNLQCPQCDTVYTSTRAGQIQIVMVSAIVRECRNLHPGPRLVVITGGEPFRQNITPLVIALLEEDYEVQIETNGVLPVSFGLPIRVYYSDFGALIVCSPKTDTIHHSIERSAGAYKYVLNADSFDPSDGLPIRALDHKLRRRVARPPEDYTRSAIYLQPADVQDEEKNKINLKMVIGSCMTFGYTLQLQTHKLIGMD